MWDAETSHLFPAKCDDTLQKFKQLMVNSMNASGEIVLCVGYYLHMVLALKKNTQWKTERKRKFYLHFTEKALACY